MSRYLVYLAGPISGLPYGEVVNWREKVASMLPEQVEALSPMRDKEYLSRKKKLSKVGYEDHALSAPKGITCRDRNDVSRCDVLFVYLLGATQASIGTVMEIAWADIFRIPTVVVMESKNIHQHGMLQEAVGFVVETLEEGVEVVRSILGVQDGWKEEEEESE